MSTVNKIKLKKNDTVIVISGKYKGKTGKITEIQPLTNKAIVDGINIAKKHVKPNKKYPQGVIIDITKPIWISKLAIYEPTTKKASKIELKADKSGSKTRFYKSTGKEIK